MSPFTLLPEYQNDATALLVQGWLARIFEHEVLTGTTVPLKQVLLGLYNGQAHPLDLQVLGALSDADYDDAIRLIRGQRESGREPHSYFVKGAELFSNKLLAWGEPRNKVSRAPVLRKKFDPARVQWEQDNKVYLLDTLARDDLLQVACECIEVLERMDAVQHALTQLTTLWRAGEAVPEQLEPLN